MYWVFCVDIGGIVLNRIYSLELYGGDRYKIYIYVNGGYYVIFIKEVRWRNEVWVENEEWMRFNDVVGWKWEGGVF